MQLAANYCLHLESKKLSPNHAQKRLLIVAYQKKGFTN
ncbi:hypothetical protein PSFL107428_17395 [Pseudoalteromonas maricaloris]|nr:hypothetical protein [Pseudoalteromonas flavipulchra NCIMB 2033 = ATCC BAA-314]